MIEAKSNDDLDKIEESIRKGIESDFDKKLEKVDKKLENLNAAEEIDSEAIEKAENEYEKYRVIQDQKYISSMDKFYNKYLEENNLKKE